MPKKDKDKKEEATVTCGDCDRKHPEKTKKCPACDYIINED